MENQKYTEIESDNPPSLFCRIFHRRWIMWNNMTTPSHCERCANGPRWKWHLSNIKESNRQWELHLKDVDKLW